MQQDLDAAHPILNIDIIGINEIGHESANSLMTAGRSQPWLQDVDSDGNQASDVWTELWDVTFRDVVILDSGNSIVESFNLTEHNLADSIDYTSLRTKLIDAAMAEQVPWQNPVNQHDVNNDGFVVPLDVLWQINSINDEGARQLAAPTGTEVPAYYDCNGDGWLSALDALLVINYMDEVKAAGEGEPVANEASWVPFVPLSHMEQVADVEANREQTISSTLASVVPTERPAMRATPPRTPVAVENDQTSIGTADEFWAYYWNTDTSLIEQTTAP
ncbi:MAG: hypothetical protein CMJ64_16965 [Planctomycetaceae bacterium]|nr:hypothetical protein [Planctomycetaceae bacterium]